MPRSVDCSASLIGLSASLLLLLAACGSSGTLVGSPGEAEINLDAQATGFYADPNSTPATWVKSHPNDSRTPTIKSKISSQASGRWFGGWSGDITPAVRGFATAAANAGKIPILVAYNIPGRDCGQYSAGGAASDAAYKTWISNFAKAIGSRAAVVVLEPDALSQLKDCLSGTQQTARLNLIRYAVDQFANNAKNTKLYLDAGHNNWVAPAEMASRLKSANIARARGFALNTSNFGTTANNTSYGNNIVKALGSAKRFVIDTSRNGNGWNGQWCNPGGRKLGSVSKVVAGNSGLEMLLRVKTPGESDGNCGVGSGSKAGDFLPQAAYAMAK
ncbi:glycoside hydrolase family 6 protein [Deinococcus sp.]|uniref:glycoside hydrolase family 6 protein n=1 Tax=Deinococcus sp. TaxID=47478 RepID=UPI003B5B342F